MATTEQTSDIGLRQRVAWGLLILILVAGVSVLVWRLWPVPQMGTDEDVFHTVDALFTAVTARDEKLLAHCEERLRALAEEGKVPRAARKRLEAVIAKARRGSWQGAAEDLYDFMKAQRREGVEVQPRKKGKTNPGARKS